MSYDRRGIGLRFDGLPTDTEKYFLFLGVHGCHPKAAQRILDRLNEKGFDLLTVYSLLPVNKIISDLNEIGIKVSVVPPQDGWKQKYDDGEWPKEILKQIAQIKKW